MSRLPFIAGEGGVLLFIRVTPRSDRAAIGTVHAAPGGKLSLQVKVRAQPEKGKANEAAIELLAGALDLPKRAFAITAGESDRLKTVSVAGAPSILCRKLNDLIQDPSS